MIALLVGCLTPNPVVQAAEPAGMSPTDRYTSWLAERDPTATGEERTSLVLGDFRFFSVPSGRGKRLEAAVSPHTLVTKEGVGDTASLLRAGTPEAVARAVAWLHGTASLLVPGAPAVSSLEKKYTGLTGIVTAPNVTDEGGAARLDAWYVFQPGDQVSHLTIDATADGARWSWAPLPR